MGGTWYNGISAHITHVSQSQSSSICYLYHDNTVLIPAIGKINDAGTAGCFTADIPSNMKGYIRSISDWFVYNLQFKDFTNLVHHSAGLQI